MTAPSPTDAAPGALPRTLGFWAATAVVAGNIIGSGIFRVPSGIAADAGSVGGIAAVWILGGVVTLCGALAMAELAAAFPRTGGVFVYLREGYGPLVAFLYGWTMLFAAPAGAAGVALVFAEYLGTLLPLSLAGTRLVAAGAILVVAAANYRSVRGASAIQGAATAAKLGAIAALVAAALLLGDGSAGALAPGADRGTTSLAGVGVGLAGALFAYNGFQDMLSVAGEVRDPARVLPRALLAGMAAVVAVYLAANLAYLYVLPLAALQASPLVARDVAVRVIGAAGAGVVAATVMVSTFGTLNGLVLANPRLFFAMGSEGLLFRVLARVHPRFGTPHVAVAAYAAASLVFVWSRSFEQLAALFVLGIWPFLALAVAGVVVLRRARPELARPYRTPGYPVVPVVFVVATIGVMASALVADPLATLAGIGVTLLGVPGYWAWRRRRGAP